jgi:hypothetical protein
MRIPTLLVATTLMLGAAPAASAQGLQFFAVLLGGNEVSSTGDADAGDQNGYGSAYVTFAGNELCYAIFVHEVANPNAAHIHSGKAGENGGIFIALTPPASGDSGHISDCLNVTAKQRNQIRNKPNEFYINVHNSQFPGGALRGQLF